MIKKAVMLAFVFSLSAMDRTKKITSQKDIPCDLCSTVNLVTLVGSQFIHCWNGSREILHTLTYHGECAQYQVCKYHPEDTKHTTYLSWHNEFAGETHKIPAILSKQEQIQY